MDETGFAREAHAFQHNIFVLFPDIAAEWDYSRNGALLPQNVMPSSSKKVHWKCKYGHEWAATVDSRTRNNYGCPYCSGKRAISGQNDLRTLFPDIVGEWDYEGNEELYPEQILPQSNRKVAWICQEGHKWFARVADRVKGTKCPYCTGKIVLTEKSLATLFPAVAAEWDNERNVGLNPKECAPFSEKKVWWKCSRGHNWQAVIANRTKHGSGCPYCQRKIPIQGENDLATTHPHLIAQWCTERNGACTPEKVMASSSRKVWWRCKRGHVWEASVASRAARNAGCPYCCGQRVIRGETDLASQSPRLLAQWDFRRNAELTPHDVSFFSNRKVWWICAAGHSWKTTVYKRSCGQECPYCVKKKR